MKSIMNRLMVAAAAIVVVAGAASAQSMKVEVPFSFGVGGKVMPAGAYSVATTSGMRSTPLFRLLNVDAKESVLTLSKGAHEGAAESSAAKLVFRCEADKCSLEQIWTGTGAYDLGSPKSSRLEAALISIPATRAD